MYDNPLYLHLPFISTMNLILDFGNTRIKIAVFFGDKILYQENLDQINTSLLEKLFRRYPEIQNSILSSGVSQSKEINNLLSDLSDTFLLLDHKTNLPIKNTYKSPESLGYDRIANVVGASTEFPENNTLVIDVGTAITYDFINSLGEFLGGNISPGANMRAISLHNYTAKLPLVKLHNNPLLLSKTTEDALNSGILNGILFEIEAYIKELKDIYSDLKIILTGGDINLFDKKLKKTIFVDSNLNLKGLNRILNYNAEKTN